jgi:tRNA threonylcarbamoyladenosine biosynthesis protein TsaE
MKQKSFEDSLIYSLDQLDQAVDFLWPLFGKSKVMTFTGALGAGKTTLVQALLRRAGVVGPIQSPTFTYMVVYKVDPEMTIYHFDLYRLSSLQDFLQAGFDEYLYQNDSKALIEWPEIVMPILMYDVCHVAIDYEGFDQRKLICVCSSKRALL